MSVMSVYSGRKKLKKIAVPFVKIGSKYKLRSNILMRKSSVNICSLMDHENSVANNATDVNEELIPQEVIAVENK